MYSLRSSRGLNGILVMPRTLEVEAVSSHLGSDHSGCPSLLCPRISGELLYFISISHRVLYTALTGHLVFRVHIRLRVSLTGTFSLSALIGNS